MASSEAGGSSMMTALTAASAPEQRASHPARPDDVVQGLRGVPRLLVAEVHVTLGVDAANAVPNQPTVPRALLLLLALQPHLVRHVPECLPPRGLEALVQGVAKGNGVTDGVEDSHPTNRKREAQQTSSDHRDPRVADVGSALLLAERVQTHGEPRKESAGTRDRNVAHEDEHPLRHANRGQGPPVLGLDVGCVLRGLEEARRVHDNVEVGVLLHNLQAQDPASPTF
mmetsp:Transcript_111805/g.312542  ORF Transcript_111805/g.312542 Transcript_111805/m.312542 type:complete len:227 (+) Transcript_111805:584-1264(+)